MQTLFTVLACGLALCRLTQAAELPLNGGVAAANEYGEVARVDTQVHLGLASREDAVGIPLNASGINCAAMTPLVGSEAAPGVVVGTPTIWGSGAGSQTLDLDGQAQLHKVAGLAGVLPGGAASGAGVPDSWVYAGLGVLLLGLGWACSGWVGRPASVHSVQSWSEAPSNRPRRVKMVALNVSR